MRRRIRGEGRHCLRLARRLSGRPANRSGADKTWVLDLMSGLDRLLATARRIPRRRHARLR